MLSFGQSLSIVIVTVGVSLLFIRALNSIWSWEKRRVHNDLIGWQLSILGTTYAVMLGFMLYTVWTAFGSADLNTDYEANELVNVYRLAEGLPDQQRSQLQELTRTYADVVIEKDWPEMAEDKLPEESQKIDAAMWTVLMSVKAASATEITAEDHTITELAAMTEHRRTRLLESASRLPGVLWCVLIIGAAVTVTSASMFGSPNIRLHMLQVFSFSLLVSLVLVAIGDIDRPFQGGVHVSSYAFERAREAIREHR